MAEKFLKYCSMGELDKVLENLDENIMYDFDEAISLAAGNGHIEVVRILHQNGAKIDAENNKPLRLAIKNGHIDVVEYLRENGADIDQF